MNCVKITPNRHQLLLFIVLLCLATLCAAEVAVPPLRSRVTDLTATLSSQEIKRLEKLLAKFEAEKGSQLAVLIIPSTQPETIEQYAIRVAENWQLGRKGVDDGILLLIAKQDRSLRIEVGYGLEGALPDATARRIVDEIIVPKFRTGKYAKGIEAGIQGIINVIEGEPLPAPTSKRGGDVSGSGDMGLAPDSLLPILVVFLVLGRILQTSLGRLPGATVTGGIAGVIVWLIFTSLAMAILLAVAVFVFSLTGSLNRGIYRGAHGRWTGGSRGGFGGGFGGGGGGFGGGGASGRW
ncbi:TPM domain-containing protein [Nitrosomonas sp. ANs5]|uniref:TPM domain-containing protein n=1 Tax=Nitrosomonas sp. ANs5 TaxID=3423941 RepID=UPI003D32F145